LSTRGHSHDLFVRASGIAGQANGPPVEGAKVSYDTKPTDKGPTAIVVEVPWRRFALAN